MKLAASILLFWLGLLTVQPAVAVTCQALHSENCCKKGNKCSAKEESAPCKKENNDCCAGGLCTPCSICSCCFSATLEKENFLSARNSESLSQKVLKNSNSLAGFTSQCFQPPEI